MVRFRSPAPITGSPSNFAPKFYGVSHGRVPEWPKGADCKSVSNAFGGSNPPPSTNKNLNRTIRLRFLFVRGTVDEPCALNSAMGVMFRSVDHLTIACNSSMRAGSAACTARRLRPFLPPAMRRNACPNTTLFNPPHLWRTSTTSFLSYKLYFDHHFLRIKQIIQTMKVLINKIRHYQFDDNSSILRSVDFL